ncbi:SIR2 family NAD-dependent protein deacylase [Sanyastnella coralliicola]|uniref:SIR2 family NAD-dependent protein deacylase n=1 Tax=Sanyastnella coralliicola TaxID=3069118 RepID=UPI0027BA3B43|nr:NAD-dependent deacylase [Longitalea sp. SCSIO 12813]
MKRIVVMSGAGMSAESGIPTFRGADGLWEGHRIEEVATPEAWHADYRKVLEFYNFRRKGVMEAEPNEGHLELARMQDDFDVQIVTQNIDDLHERAGSNNVMHLHGEIMKARSTVDPSLITSLDHWELKDGDRCEKGSQLRPHIVWFGEAVPMMESAIAMAQTADIFLVVGTSLLVYPAASLVNFVRPGTPIYLIDPNLQGIEGSSGVTVFNTGAVEGMKLFREAIS